MSAPFDFGRDVSAWLDEQAPRRAPADLSDRVIRDVRRTRHRPAWATLERWIPMETRMHIGALPRTAIVLAALGLLLAAFATLSVASQPTTKLRLPPRAGVAGNGLIAYDAADGNLYAADPEGQGVRVLVDRETELRGPSWSPDGRKLAYFEMVETGPGTFDDKALVHVLDVDDDRDLELTGGQLVVPALYSELPSASGLTWSPDSARVAFTVLEPNSDPSDDQTAIPGVLVARADGTGMEPYTVPGVDVMDATWSPDGRRMAFKGQTRRTNDTGAWVAGTDGKGAHQLTARQGCVKCSVNLGPQLTSSADLTDTFSFASPQWSPDGRSLALQCCIDGGHDIWLVDSQHAYRTNVSGDPRDEYWPSWSPDGSMLAFQRTVNEGESPDAGSEIVIELSDGSVVRTVAKPVTGANGPMVWAPDGSALLTTTGTPGLDDWRPMLMSVDGSFEARILEAPRDFADWIGLSWQRVAEAND